VRARDRSLLLSNALRNPGSHLSPETLVDGDYYLTHFLQHFAVAISLFAFPLSKLYSVLTTVGAMARPSCSKLLSLLLILPFVSLVASICYCVRDNDIFDCSSTETACGNASSVDTGAQLCCVNGDQCGADSICHFAKPIANTSGYYLGGCTDPTYNDPVCQKHCSQYHIPIHTSQEVSWASERSANGTARITC
jgi:hypothetical protein